MEQQQRAFGVWHSPAADEIVVYALARHAEYSPKFRFVAIAFGAGVNRSGKLIPKRRTQPWTQCRAHIFPRCAGVGSLCSAHRCLGRENQRSRKLDRHPQTSPGMIDIHVRD